MSVDPPASASGGSAPSPGTRYQRLFAPHLPDFDPESSQLVSELLALTDLGAALTEPMDAEQVASLLLLVGLGESGARWAGLVLPDGSGSLRTGGRRGLSDPEWGELTAPEPERLPGAAVLQRSPRSRGADDGPADAPSDAEGPFRALMARAGADSAVLLRTGDRLAGVLLLGEPHPDLTSSGPDFLEALAVIGSAALDKCRRDQELRSTNRRLALRMYQLRSLLDLTAGLHRARDEGTVWDLLLHGAMGHVLASRGSVVAGGRVVAAKGPRGPREDWNVLVLAETALSGEQDIRSVRNLEDQGTARDLAALKIGWVVPFSSGQVRGILFLGETGFDRALGSADYAFLHSLAGRAAAAVESARLARATIEKEKELVVARRIQSRLLPADAPRLPGWDLSGVNIPCLAVGGDYYDYLPLGDRIFVTIADVSGKGAGPAIIMASVQASLRAYYRHVGSAIDGAALELNHLLHENTEDNRYMTAVLAALRPGTGRLDYLNAGHVRPVVVRAAGSVERLTTGSTVLGLFPEIATEVGTVELGPGDLLAMYTDGLSEVEDLGERQFDDERIIEGLVEVRDRDARTICGDLLSRARAFAGSRALGDDLTLVVLRRTAAGP